jgi:hypothetical protein
MTFILKTMGPATALLAAMTMAQVLPAQAAPAQLYNKTIQLSWSVAVSEIDPDGKPRNVMLAVNHTIYVSSAGRLFARASRASGRKSRGGDLSPGDTHNKGGEAVGIGFQGNQLVGNVAFAQGARRFIATFDPSFSSCTVKVIFGREGGGLRRSGIDHVTRTIVSETPSGESCSIREGNPF